VAGVEEQVQDDEDEADEGALEEGVQEIPENLKRDSHKLRGNAQQRGRDLWKANKKIRGKSKKMVKIKYCIERMGYKR
jgi:hypothetical protein